MEESNYPFQSETFRYIVEINKYNYLFVKY